MRLIGYIRVSTDEQARDGRSLSIQDLQLQRYCELYGHELVDVVVDEGVSASVDFERRPGGQRTLEALKDGAADGVVVQRLDRMFRITLDGLQTFSWFDRRGLVVQSVNEKIDTAAPEGKLQLTLILATAEYERNKIQQRAREVSAGLREQGRAWGPVPYGCIRDGERLFRDPELWGVREEIVRLYDGGEGISLRAIAAELRERAIPAPGGGRLWHASTLTGIIRSHCEMEHIPLLADGAEAPVSLQAVV